MKAPNAPRRLLLALLASAVACSALLSLGATAAPAASCAKAHHARHGHLCRAGAGRRRGGMRARIRGAGLPPQGVYEECAPAKAMETCVEHLARLGAAGFRAVLNYDVWDASREDINAYAEAAHAAGVEIIWPFNNRPWREGGGLAAAYPALAARCGCDPDTGLVEAALRVVRSFPATWGYYVGDEVDPAEAA